MSPLHHKLPVYFVALLLCLIIGIILFESISSKKNAAQLAAVWSEMHDLSAAITSYQKDNGHLPDAKSNSALVDTLTGDNPHKKDYLSLKPRELDAHGELIDPWGTPLRISQAGHFTISSAGPDESWGTADDLKYELKR